VKDFAIDVLFREVSLVGGRPPIDAYTAEEDRWDPGVPLLTVIGGAAVSETERVVG